MQKIALQTPADQSRNTLIIRNFFKFLPWELAHTGVHWIIYYSAEKIEVPVWVILLVPQITALAYFISIISSKGVSSIYDRIAHTKIRM